MTGSRTLSAVVLWLLAGGLAAEAAAQPAAAEVWIERGKQAFRRADYRGAVEAFGRAAEIDPRLPGPHYGLCIARLRLDEARPALEDCTRAIRLDGNYAAAYYTRGLIRAERLGDDRGALADYDRAISLDSRYAAAYFKRGNSRARLGDRRGGLADYDTAIRLVPDDADAHFNRGVVRFELGDLRGALADLQQAARLFREQGDEAGYRRAADGVRQVEAELRR